MGEKFDQLCGETRAAFEDASYLPYVDAERGGIYWNGIDSISSSVVNSVTSGAVRVVLKELMDEEALVAPDALAGMDSEASFGEVLCQLVATSVAQKLRSTDAELLQEENDRYDSFKTFMEALQRPSTQSASPAIKSLRHMAPMPSVLSDPAETNGDGHLPERQRIEP